MIQIEAARCRSRAWFEPGKALLWLAAVTAVMFLSGCDLGDRFASAEARINAARALDPALQATHRAFQSHLAGDAVSTDLFNRQWADRLKLRALTCSRGYKPRFYESSAAVGQRLPDVSCFSDADRGLRRWLGLQRVRHVLAQPPLRTVPPTPPSLISHREVIRTIALARNAPVAVITGASGAVAALDMIDGRQLFQEPGADSRVMPDLSPNGRLFAQVLAGKVAIRAVDGGESMVDLEGMSGVLWVDDRVLVLTQSSGPLKVLDLASGEESTIAGLNTGWGAIIQPLGRQERRYLLLAGRSAAHLEVVDVGGRFEMRLTGDKVGEFSHNFAFNTGAFSSDGTLWMHAGPSLLALAVDTLEPRDVDLKPVGVQSVWPTSRADEFLLHMHLPNSDGITSTFRHVLYSHRAGTLAQVNFEERSSKRMLWLASMGRLAMIEGQRIRLVEPLPASEPRPVAAVVAAFIDEMNQRRLAAALVPPVSAWNGMAVPGAVAPAPRAVAIEAPLAAQLRDAQIEGVGVYQGASQAPRGSSNRQEGVVEVRVRRSSRPMALVLSSYEPVRWVIVAEPGARLAAVMVSGYHASTVVGAGSARVYQIGQAYAYGRDSGYAQLQQAVQQWCGKPISLFQGRYEGATFSVGGT